MRVKFCLVATVMMMFPAWASSLPQAAHRTYAQNYKDAALAYCISQAYSANKDIRADASASASGIDNWGEYDLENSSGEVPALVKQYLARHYPSKQGNGIQLNLMKCIDMYHSEELMALVKRYVPHPDNNYAEDYTEK